MAIILIVEDHTLVRKTLLNCLRLIKESFNFLEAANGDEAISIVNSQPVDLILLDLQMPIKNGIETLIEIKKINSKIKVIVLTMHSESSLIIHALKLGANGFLTKNINLDTLEETIDRVLAGDSHPDRVASNVIEEFNRFPDHFPNLNLSPREFQLLELIKLGQTNKDMAKHLELEVFTIESYRKTLMEKTKCSNTADLVSFAFKIGVNLPSQSLKSRVK